LLATGAVLVAVFVAAGVLVGSPAAGAADASISVSDLEAAPGEVRFLLRANDLPTDATIDPSKVTVKAGETTLTTEAARVSRSATKLPERGLMVVLDVSGSVAGARLEAARAAVVALAQSLPDDVSVGLIAVSTTPAVILPPSKDRAALTAATSQLSSSGDTALYDAVGLAATELRKANLDANTERRVLVLSDGLDTSSQTRLAELRSQLSAQQLAVDVVAFQANNAGLDALQEIAAAGGGRVLTAPDATFVTSAFRAVAGGFSIVLAVEAAVPSDLGGQQATLVVSIDIGGQALTASVPVTFAAAPATRTPANPSFGWVPSWTPWVLGGLFFVGAILLVVLLVWPRSGTAAQVKHAEMLSRGWAGAKPATSAMARSALAATAAVVRSRGLDDRITLSLEQAGMRMRPHEWVLLQACAAVTMGALVFLVLGWPGLLVGAVLGWLLAMAYRSIKASRRANLFAEQLPDAIQLVIGAIRSGFSLPQALDAVVRESPEPVAAEFGRALAEHRLGADLSDALEAVVHRTGSDDLNWAVMAIRIHREVGGNLAEVLQTTVDTIRERARLRRHVRSLSAEGRLSAWVLIGLPILLGLFMFSFRRDYLRPLYTEPIGMAMLLVGGGLLVLGIVWMSRTVKVEV
jgi:tight adherence protein B